MANAATALLSNVAVAAREQRELDCLMAPRMMIKIGSPVEGVVGKVLVDRGDRVKQE